MWKVSSSFWYRWLCFAHLLITLGFKVISKPINGGMHWDMESLLAMGTAGYLPERLCVNHPLQISSCATHKTYSSFSLLLLANIFTANSFNGIITESVETSLINLDSILKKWATSGVEFDLQALFFAFTLSSFVKLGSVFHSQIVSVINWSWWFRCRDWVDLVKTSAASIPPLTSSCRLPKHSISLNTTWWIDSLIHYGGSPISFLPMAEKCDKRFKQWMILVIPLSMVEKRM